VSPISVTGSGHDEQAKDARDPTRYGERVSYSIEQTADRAGAAVDSVDRLARLGIVEPDPEGRFSPADVRLIQVVHSLERAGLPLEGLATLVQARVFSLDFIEAAGSRVFAPLTDVTFADLGERTGIPVDLLLVLREAVGGPRPDPQERVREDELSVSALVELQHGLGFRPQAIEQALRVYGESLRRIAETEAEWWRTEVQQPMLAGGAAEGDIGRFAAEHSPKLSAASDQAILTIYHAQQALAWLTNIASGIAGALEQAGLHTRPEVAPAMCFLDITGYTRLTHEQGDRAAAELAERLRRIVERTSVEHGGRPVKWLGDGVMVYFPDPGAGVVAALEMISAISAAGLLKAHVGLHAGSVVFQEGDYYGQTVNVASRIGDYARPGEVLVSQEVVNHADRSLVRFREIGPVELKGVAEAVVLYAAEPATESR